TGRGIDPDFLPSVFDRFRQADASSSRSSSGLGLGLAIAQQLVELHGGSIEAYSAGEGLGSTFTVRLPASSQSAALEAVGTTGSAGSAESPATISTLGREKLEGVRVVVVDDEREVLEMSAFLLTRQGADVRTASSASAALDLVKTWRPDCIVSDIGMPGQDGYEFIKSVRSLSDKNGGAIPAVAVTAYVRVEDMAKALASGFQMHLAKPVDPAELVAVVQSLTGAAGRATGDGSPKARRDSSRIL
ncbi:MAG TPA: response regulator, partial [Blastocatellia bacterium]|nr:response regulator [Blastocatellia bacterium]